MTIAQFLRYSVLSVIAIGWNRYHLFIMISGCAVGAMWYSLFTIRSRIMPVFDEKALRKFIDSKLHPPATPAKLGGLKALDKLRKLTLGRKLPRL